MNLGPGMMDMMRDWDGAEVSKQAAGVARPVPCTGHTRLHLSMMCMTVTMGVRRAGHELGSRHDEHDEGLG